MDEPTEIQSTFPAPPAHYLRYTNSNLQLLAQLKEKLGLEAPSYHPTAEDSPYPDVQAIRQQHTLLADAHDVPDWDLLELQKPRADWIVEEGGYSTFGDQWQVKSYLHSPQRTSSDILVCVAARATANGRRNRDAPSIPSRPKHRPPTTPPTAPTHSPAQPL
jgi:hypothetical protein